MHDSAWIRLIALHKSAWMTDCIAWQCVNDWLRYMTLHDSVWIRLYITFDCITWQCVNKTECITSLQGWHVFISNSDRFVFGKCGFKKKSVYHTRKSWSHSSNIYRYGVATVSRIDKVIGLFCRIQSLLWGSFAKKNYSFN